MDSVSAAVFRATLVEVAVATLLIVPAYWRPCRWPVLTLSMLATVPLLCLHQALGIVVMAIAAAMWIGVWRQVPGWVTVAITTAAVAFVLPASMSIHREILTWLDKLQRTYPKQDLGERLRYERQSAEGLPPSAVAAAPTLAEPENAAAVNGSGRAEALKSLHDRSFVRFISSGGFGVGRMRYHWEYNLKLPDVDSRPLPQPAPEPPAYPADVASSSSSSPPAALTLSSSGAGAEVANRGPLPQSENVRAASLSPDLTLATKKHRQAEAAFLDPMAWGYVAGNQAAIGFEPHAFRESRITSQSSRFVTADGWTLVSLQLVSLLKHERPMAYVSSTLPNMQELAQTSVPVRPLEPFETTALESLRGGEEIVIDSRTNRIRMLGAIRATQACLHCHSVRQGTLLGAFSYRLDRDPPQFEPKSSDLR